MVDAHNHLAQLVWMRSGSLTQATEALDQALRMHGKDESLWAAKAALLQGAGDARGAYYCLAPGRSGRRRPLRCCCAQVLQPYSSRRPRHWHSPSAPHN